MGAEDGERAMKAELAALEPELSSVQRKLEEKNRHIEACQERCGTQHTDGQVPLINHQSLFSDIGLLASNAVRPRL